MARSIANIIAEHEAARVATEDCAARFGLNIIFKNPRMEAEVDFPTYGKFLADEDFVLFDLCDAPCASDDEFFVKVAYMLKINPVFIRIALVEVLQDHLKRREALGPDPGGG